MPGISDMTEEHSEQIKLALTNLAPHQAVVYHTGKLAKDREATPGVKNNVDLVARLAWQLMEAGLIVLAQRKRGDGEYDYVATGRTPPRSENKAGGRTSAIAQI